MRRAVWNQGWWAHADHCASPHHGPRPDGEAIDMVVIHSISLPAGVYGGAYIHQLFLNRLDTSAHPEFERLRGLQVSAHFLIRRDGFIVQFVSCDHRAWHAGQSNWRGRNNCNDFSIGIELEGLEGLSFEKPQYKALLRLIRSIRRHYPIAHIVGHEHIAPDRKQDPGAQFNWRHLRQELGEAGLSFPGMP
ncbi:MAG: 1,6-anhydro-N-acetylmuramyl-L-alanine amidase AmpD [Burkholderiales bacterium]|jgi:AmpD protein